MRAWHFTGTTLLDGRPVPNIGERLVHRGPIVPCQSGLHASVHPFDALRYAPGPYLHLCEVGGVMVPHGDPVDKHACEWRTYIASMDATPLLRYFARQQALSVVHLWDPPQIVLDYLMGDDDVKDADLVASRSVARDAAWDAARATAWAAARADAWAAASAAARADAWAAARAAARADARDDFSALVNEAFEDWL